MKNLKKRLMRCGVREHADKERGFTLIEVIVTILVLSIFISTIGVSFLSTMKENLPEVATTARFLATEKLEELCTEPIDSISSEARGQVPGYPSYERAVEVTQVSGTDLSTLEQGSGYRKIRVTIYNQGLPNGISVETLRTGGVRYTAASMIYWSDRDGDYIRRAHLKTIDKEGVDKPLAIALDAATGRMYWTDRDGDWIRRANLDGSAAEALVTDLIKAEGIALDAAGGKMYWADKDANKIARANLDGSGVEVLINAEDKPLAVALDLGNGKIYYTDKDGDKIRRANLNGTGMEDLITSGLGKVEGIALDVAGGKMYWADKDQKRVRRANLNGTGVEDLINSLGVQDLITTGLGKVEGIALDETGGKMYWADKDGKKIARANLDGSGVEDLISAEDKPLAVALDLGNGKVYYSDKDGDKIRRANLDGTGMEDLVTTGLGKVEGIALDVLNGKMYWADKDANKIARANLDGSGVEDVITGLDKPLSIATLFMSVRGTAWQESY
jgi:prepilin-type N-terminal cleavage/methylation domain-containing protein